jgi:hypothetical protein
MGQASGPQRLLYVDSFTAPDESFTVLQATAKSPYEVMQHREQPLA